MGSTRFLDQIFIISAVCFVGIFAKSACDSSENLCFENLTNDLEHKFKAKVEQWMEGDATECTNKVIAVLADEDTGKLGDFNKKSDFEKGKILVEEYRTMLRNGNNISKHYEERVSNVVNQTMIDERLQFVLELPIWKDYDPKEKEKALKGFNCGLASVFNGLYAIAKDSVRKGRVGHSETFFPMVKDIITSANSKGQTVVESNLALFALHEMSQLVIPDFVLATVNLITHIPEDMLEQSKGELKNAISSLDVVPYVEVLNTLQITSSPMDFLHSLLGDEVECTKRMVAVFANEESASADFHAKSDLEKVLALREEFLKMLRNGNNATKHFEERLTYLVGRHGGNIEEKMEKALKDTDGLKKVGLKTCMVAGFFEGAYNVTKYSMRSGRLGNSETFLPMLKDMVMSINLKEQTFIDSPLAQIAAIYTFIGAIPDVGLSAISLLSYIPEDAMKEHGPEISNSFYSFDPEMYMNVLKSLRN